MTSGAPRRTATTCRPEQSYLSHILYRRHALLHACRCGNAQAFENPLLSKTAASHVALQPTLHAHASQCSDHVQA